MKNSARGAGGIPRTRDHGASRGSREPTLTPVPSPDPAARRRLPSPGGIVVRRLKQIRRRSGPAVCASPIVLVVPFPYTSSRKRTPKIYCASGSARIFNRLQTSLLANGVRLVGWLECSFSVILFGASGLSKKQLEVVGEQSSRQVQMTPVDRARAPANAVVRRDHETSGLPSFLGH
jgi:hypothetical protein